MIRRLVARLRLRLRPLVDPERHPHRRGWLAFVLNRRRPIFVDYRVDPRPRYGHGRSAHPEIGAIIERRESAYGEVLDIIGSFAGDLRSVPALPGPSTDSGPRGDLRPSWSNVWFGGLDGAALYGLVRSGRPSRYVEIGSGESSRWARRAVADGGLATSMTSIDPEPRAAVDGIFDVVVRSRLEEVDQSIFATLAAGDVLFFDGSHRTFTNSDVTVFFLEIVPRLVPGVLVHVHDVFWPADYPPQWNDRFYSEQYLLAAMLLADAERYPVVFPASFVAGSPRLGPIAAALLRDAGAPAAPAGSSFWFRTAPPAASHRRRDVRS